MQHLQFQAMAFFDFGWNPRSGEAAAVTALLNAQER
jgi:hypothetical protein